MRTVHLWQCPCGAHYKAICDIDEAAETRVVDAVSCDRCGRTAEVDGRLMGVFVEYDHGLWKSAGGK